MKGYGLPFSCFFLLLAAVITLACGSSPHMLQAVTVSPQIADANGSPVQFTATGYYTTPPSPVTPLTATWGACNLDGSVTSAVSVGSTGLAQCAAGSVGTYMVWAFGTNPSRGVCNAINACGGGCGRITGIANLTCP